MAVFLFADHFMLEDGTCGYFTEHKSRKSMVMLPGCSVILHQADPRRPVRNPGGQFCEQDVGGGSPDECLKSILARGEPINLNCGRFFYVVCPEDEKLLEGL
jgi:hypothetical protein